MDAGDTDSRMFVQRGGSGDDVIRIAIRLGLLAFLIYWSFVLLRPFIPVLVWAAVLAVALTPAFDWLSAHLGHRPRVAAFVITVVVLAVSLGPATWLGIGLVDGLRETMGYPKAVGLSVGQEDVDGRGPSCNHAHWRSRKNRSDEPEPLQQARPRAQQNSTWPPPLSGRGRYCFC